MPSILCSIITLLILLFLLTETDKMDSTQEEEILLDENKDSEGFEFYMTHGVETSPDHTRIAYAVDTSGGEKYTLHVKELETGKELLKTPIKVSTRASCCSLKQYLLRQCLLGQILLGQCSLGHCA